MVPTTLIGTSFNVPEKSGFMKSLDGDPDAPKKTPGRGKR